MSRSAKHDHTVPGKRSRSPGPRFEAGAAPPPSLLHAVVAAQGILPSEVSIHSPRTEQPRKPEPRTSGSRPSRKLQYPSKEVDQDENGGDYVAEEVERDAAMLAMPTEAAVVGTKRTPRCGRSSEAVGALSAEPRTSGSKRVRRLPPPSGLAEPAKQSRRDNGGGEGGGEGSGEGGGESSGEGGGEGGGGALVGRKGFPRWGSPPRPTHFGAACLRLIRHRPLGCR